MPRTKSKAPVLRCYQKFAWDNGGVAWEWRIAVPGRFVLKPYNERTYRSRAGAKRAARKIARELGIELPRS